MKFTNYGLLAVPLIISGMIFSAPATEAFGGGFGNFGKFGGNVNMQMSKLSNGLQMTVTTEDSKALSAMHERAERFALMQSITHTVTNLDNGIQIDMTSDNAEAVAMLQEREHKTPRLGDVTVTQENLNNGVRITKTSTDSETVERMQNQSEKGDIFGIQGRKGREHGGRFGVGSCPFKGQPDEAE